jgi:hypothetical protein
MILASCGHRKLTDIPARAPDAWRDEIARPEVTGIRLGGATGWDLIAFVIAATAERRHPITIYVPNRLEDQPIDSQVAIRALRGPRDRVIELGLVDAGESPRKAPLRRNIAMLIGAYRTADGWQQGERAGRLFAAFSGNQRTGTAAAIREAESRGIEVVTNG